LLDSDTPGHAFRCWFPVGTPEGRAALERNRTEGRLPVAAAEAAVPEADATATLTGEAAPAPGSV
jgi:hypothetical protein